MACLKGSSNKYELCLVVSCNVVLFHSAIFYHTQSQRKWVIPKLLKYYVNICLGIDLPSSAEGNLEDIHTLYISSRHCGYIVSSFFFIVVQVQLSPLLSPDLPTPTSHIQSSPTPLSLSMGPLYMFLDDPSPSLPCYPSSSSPLVTVSLSFISMSLVLFCLLVCFPLLGLYSKNPETSIQKNLCTPMFITAQFTIAKCQKQPRSPSVQPVHQ